MMGLTEIKTKNSQVIFLTNCSTEGYILRGQGIFQKMRQLFVLGYFPVRLKTPVTARNQNLLQAGLEPANITLAHIAYILIFRQ